MILENAIRHHRFDTSDEHRPLAAILDLVEPVRRFRMLRLPPHAPTVRDRIELLVVWVCIAAVLVAFGNFSVGLYHFMTAH